MALHILEDNDDTLLDEGETAAELHIHRRTLRRWDALGIGPPSIMVGRRKRMRRKNAIRAWLLAREVS